MTQAAFFSNALFQPMFEDQMEFRASFGNAYTQQGD